MNRLIGCARSVLTAMVVLACGASNLTAQHIDSLPIGSRISVTLPDSLRQFIVGPKVQSLHATLTGITADSLYLRIGISTPFPVARSNIRGIFLSRGVQRGRSALAMASFTALFASVMTQREDRFSVKALQVGGSATLGAILGAVRPFESWKRVKR